MHAASVEIGDGAVLIAGWSESGKTETALALLETGARFQSDKWTVVSAEGTAAAFPIDVGVRGWALRYLPTLRAALPASARRQLRATRLATTIAGGFLGRAPKGRVGQAMVAAVRRALALGDRAPVSPSQLRAAYGQDDDPARVLPLRAVVFLSTDARDQVMVRPAQAERTAGRLARSAAYERRPYFALVERALYALPGAARQDLPAGTIEARSASSARLLRRPAVLESARAVPRGPAPSPRLSSDGFERRELPLRRGPAPARARRAFGSAPLPARIRGRRQRGRRRCRRPRGLLRAGFATIDRPGHRRRAQERGLEGRAVGAGGATASGLGRAPWTPSLVRLFARAGLFRRAAAFGRGGFPERPHAAAKRGARRRTVGRSSSSALRAAARAR